MEAKIRDFATAMEKLGKAGYLRNQDLVFIKPLSYEDETHVTRIADAVPGKSVLVEGTCIESRVFGKWKHRNLECVVEDGSSQMKVLFMSFTPGMRKAMAKGNRFRLYGKLSDSLFRQMIHPRIRSATRDLPVHMTARYPIISKVSEAILARMTRKELDKAMERRDTVPDGLRKLSETARFSEALRILHMPRPKEFDAGKVEKTAIESLKHDEWVAHIIFRRFQNKKLKRRKAVVMKSVPADIDEFEQKLPFKLTSSQRKAMLETAADIGKPEAMRRLIHGDVGCGKTLVAAFACWLSARAGQLAAIMCPTVILANQHYVRLAPLYERLGIKCVLLLSSVRGKDRAKALADVQDGGNTVVIGTHALVQEKTKMPGLSLAVIDEQHRFGVRQRKALESKGPGAHVLMMSATPIPRTLELGLLSHLDISKMTERPHKSNIRTLVVRADRVNEVLGRIIRNKLQAYWICPLISRSAKLNLRSAEEEFERIKKLTPGLEISVIHGKMDAAMKLSAMKDFEAGKTRILVATTVVEVGVDAPEADVIVIDHAERLGLSQIHQLRGRVGRGEKAGFCALLYEPGLSEAAIGRLKVLRENANGFEIAREDLRQRGPGDIVGKRQHGMPKYHFADLDDEPSMLERAKLTGQLMMRDHPRLAGEHIHLWLGDAKLVSQRAEAQGRRRTGESQALSGHSSQATPRPVANRRPLPQHR